LYRWQQQAHQNANDGYHNEQFHQRKSFTAYYPFSQHNLVPDTLNGRDIDSDRSLAASLIRSLPSPAQVSRVKFGTATCSFITES
jgi:hypothetical protein